MSSVYPPLTYRDVIRILVTLGFSMKPKTGTSHEKWVKTTENKRCVVTVDKHEQPFDDFLVSSMAKQAGVSKKNSMQPVSKLRNFIIERKKLRLQKLHHFDATRIIQ